MRMGRLGMGGVGMLFGVFMGWIARGWTERARAEKETEAQLEGNAVHEEQLVDELAVLEPSELAQLLSQAWAAAEKTPLGRAELVTLAHVEDLVHSRFEVAWRTWDKNRQDPILSERKQAHEDLYKAVLQLSDAAVERFFTPEAVEGVPWRDLLADPGAWKTSELQGFESKLENGVLHLVGPARPTDWQGVTSIGDGEDWRDLVLDLEFTIQRGGCELFFRLSPVWQKNVESRELTTDDGFMEAGRTYRYLFRVIGSTLIEEDEGEDSDGPLRDRISWTQIRKGALGISVPPESEVTISKLRARILR